MGLGGFKKMAQHGWCVGIEYGVAVLEQIRPITRMAEFEPMGGARGMAAGTEIEPGTGPAVHSRCNAGPACCDIAKGKINGNVKS